jgi:hypothetical protein
MEWQTIAKALPYDRSTRIVHCGSTKDAMVSHSNAGVNLFCFKCGANDFVGHGPRSAAEILAARRATESLTEARSMPSRVIALDHPECPPTAFLWTLKTGLTPEVSSEVYGMRYDPLTRRVCIPLEGGFIARAVYDDKPKYIRSGSAIQKIWHMERTDDLVVVTEDILSAIKVYRAGYSSIAVLGTNISPTTAASIGAYPNVVCWTDADKAGDKAWVQLRQRLSLFELNLTRIRTEEDPKNITLSGIKRLLENKDG